MDRFAGRVAWVTGAGGGIGRATALRLASEGASVGISTLHESEARRTVADCVALGAHAFGTTTDMASADQVLAAHAEIARELGPVGVLVNNVGINQPPTPFLDTSDEVFENLLAVNFMSAVRATRAVLPGMLERSSGSIVSVASAQGLMGWPRASAYAASKGALMAWTRQLASEVSPLGVRVNSIVPGVIMTEMQQAVLDAADDPEEAVDSAANLHLIGRLGLPEEMAAAIAFAASDDASFMTGSILTADGGCLVKGH